MFDITAFGELLIDYTPAGKSPSGMDLFEQNPGGAPANVLACASKLGQKTAFIGKIGADMQGEFLRKTLQDANINTDGLISDENYFTTLAFVSLKENGERSFSFARKPGADTQIC
ncbi:MAG TPA: PfkB family carbohydrate kinase, partial [Anaerovoracaceae bacterium]|nr:PfkB family carbohydrate kinase [Anaerovoracaceae bacterium]